MAGASLALSSTSTSRTCPPSGAPQCQVFVGGGVVVGMLFILFFSGSLRLFFSIGVFGSQEGGFCGFFVDVFRADSKPEALQNPAQVGRVCP